MIAAALASADLTVTVAPRDCRETEQIGGGTTTTRPPSVSPTTIQPTLNSTCVGSEEYRAWTVTNRGPSPAADLTLTVTGDVDVMVPAHERKCTDAGRRSAVCSFGTLAPGASATVDVNFASAHRHTVTGTVSSALPDPVPQDNKTVDAEDPVPPR